MHVTHSLVLNRHLNTVLYVVALPLSHTASPAPSMAFLSCCVGKTLSNSPVEDHWRLRDLSATILSDVNRKCMSGGMVTRRHGNQYPKMQRQIFVTLNKVLHNPKTTLPSVYGAVCCEGRRRVGREAFARWGRRRWMRCCCRCSARCRRICRDCWRRRRVRWRTCRSSDVSMR